MPLTIDISFHYAEFTRVLSYFPADCHYSLMFDYFWLAIIIFIFINS